MKRYSVLLVFTEMYQSHNKIPLHKVQNSHKLRKSEITLESVEELVPLNIVCWNVNLLLW